jgi:hypothetical protein
VEFGICLLDIHIYRLFSKMIESAMYANKDYHKTKDITSETFGEKQKEQKEEESNLKIE